MPARYIISKNIDVWGLSLSSLIVFFLLQALNESSIFYLILALSISVVLDNGHVYMTLSRVVKEFDKHKTFFLSVPALIFATFFTWLYFDIPYFWSMVIYSTFFHFARQIYGINRWYMRKDKLIHSKFRDFVIYAVVLLPIIAMHFNPYSTLVFYTASDFFKYESLILFQATIALNALVILSWIVVEVKHSIRTKEINKYRLLFTASNALLFIGVGYIATNAIQIVIPVMMSHGFQYLILSAKMENQLYKISMGKILFILLVLAGVFGFIDTYLQDMFTMDNSYMFDYTAFEKFLLSVLLVPLFTHYIYDMKMWTSSYIKGL
jgi:hypothetical protein